MPDRPEGSFQDAWNDLKELWQKIVDAFGSGSTDQIKQSIKDLNAGMLAVEMDGVHLPSAEEILQNNSQALERKSLIEIIRDGLKDIARIGIWGSLFDAPPQDTDESDTFQEKVFDDLVARGMITREMVDTLKGSIITQGIIGKLILWFAIISILMGSFKHSMDAVQSESNQRINERFRPNLPSLGDIMRAGFIDPTKVGKIREVLVREGYKEEHIDLMFIAQYAAYTPDQAFRLWLRGKLSDEQLLHRMRENGFTDARTNELKELYVGIPPLSDILMMLAKEAFEPDQIAKFGLGSEFPVAVVEWAKKQGLSQFWAEKYWFAHWNHAAPGQVLEMLHRRLITEADVFEYYRVVEIPPYWRNLLMKISYTPFGRVDVRRMRRANVIGVQEVYESYRDQGYDHEHAVKLTTFAEQEKIESQKDLTRAQIVDAYKLGLISRANVQKFLTDSGYDIAEAEFIIETTDYKENLKQSEETIKMVGDRYKAGMIDEQQARELLNGLNLPSSKLDYYINLWDTARFKGRRRPTKTELGELFVQQVIDATTYVAEMAELGYDERHITWFLQQLTNSLGGG